jgi:hypothetical protein
MKIEPLSIPSHETVLRVTDPKAGLTRFIAIHSTALGPAAGGLRMRSYDSEAAALADVLALSRGMTLKTAAADLPLGGGKAVIMGAPGRRPRPCCAPWGGRSRRWAGATGRPRTWACRPPTCRWCARTTRYVAGLPDGPFASGDPSPRTARGVFYAMRVAAERRFGSRDLAGRRVAVQGLGHVGWHLAKLLRAAGAELLVSDIDADRAAQAVWTFGAEAVAPARILTRSGRYPRALCHRRRDHGGGRRRPCPYAWSAARRTINWPATRRATCCTSAASSMRPTTWPMAAASSTSRPRSCGCPTGCSFVSEPSGGAGGDDGPYPRCGRAERGAPHRIADRIVAERLTASVEAA